MPSLPSIRAFTNLAVEKLEDRTNPAPLYVENHVLLAPRPESDPGGVIAGVRATGLVDTVKPIGFGIYLATLKAGVTVTAALPAVGGVAGVKFAAPDSIAYPTLAPNDTEFVNGNMWHFQNVGKGGSTPGADIRATQGWDFSTGSGKFKVAVLDSGTEYTHPDLAANIWTNPGEVPGDGIDNDGNGYVDDIHGWDFGDNDNDPQPDTGQFGVSDTLLHGTHVSGTVGAVGNNGIGVAGTTWSVQMMALKIATGSGAGAPNSGTISAIAYAVANGAKVMNYSYGGGNAVNPAMEQALAGAGAKGAIFVAAAGNGGYDNDANGWSNNFVSDNAVVVAASDWADKLTSYSQYGPVNVDIAAPGGDISRYGVNEAGILSTYHNGTYKYYQGTSMATPVVTGAIANFWDANPDFTYQEVIAALRESVRKAPGWDTKVGYGGILDLDGLMSRGNLPIYATGAGAGGGPLVKVYRGTGGLKTQFFAYDQGFTGGVRVVTADVNGDGTADLIVAPGQGGGPHVKIYDGKTFQQIASFFAFESEFRGGLFVAAGDMDGDKKAEIIVSADFGGGPRVSVLKPNIEGDHVGATTVANFFAYDVGFTGGVRIAAADFTGDGLADLAVAPGLGGGPHVKIFSGLSLLAGQYDEPVKTFMAGDVNGRNGLFIAGGDMNADKVADIIVGSGAGTPVVRVYDGVNLNLFVQTFPTGGEVPGLIVDTTNIDGTLNNRTFPLNLIPPAAPPGQLPPTTDKTQRQISGYLYGIRVGTHDVNNDGVADLLLAAGPADTPTVTVLNGKTLTEMRSFNAYEDFFYGGVFVGGAGDPPPKVTT